MSPADPDLRRAARHAALVFLGFTAFFTLLLSPILLSDRRLVLIGDAAIYHYPAVFGPRDLWDPLLASGYPRMADPQMMLWYPLALPLLFTGWEWLWNPFLLAPFILGSCFTYGLVWRSTRSALGAAVGGVVFGLCEFMVWHMPHVAVIHAASWVPLLLWSLEELRHRVSRRWLAVLAVAVANCFLAGHTQIFVYGLALGGLYVLWHLRGAPAGWKAFGLAGAAGVALGLGLCAIQLLPTAEVVPQSQRTTVIFSTFITCSLPSRQLPMLVLPFAYGGTRPSLGDLVPAEAAQAFGLGAPYVGASNIVELSGFCGLLCLTLGLAGLLCGARSRTAWFWACVAGAAVVLALGDSTPVARWLYQVPVFNRFRCPGRFVLWLDVAAAVLAGRGVGALRSVPRRRAAWSLLVATVFVAAIVGLAWFTLSRQMADADLFRDFPASARSPYPWDNLALGLPLAALVLGLPLVWVWVARPGRLTGAGLLGAVIAELVVVAWLAGYWESSTPAGEFARPTAAVADLGHELRLRHERVQTTYSVPPDPSSRYGVPGNLTSHWGVPNAGGYLQLGLSRYNQLVEPYGASVLGHGPELFALRYLVRQQRPRQAHGVAWDELPLQAPRLGGDPTYSVSVTFATPLVCATRVALIADVEGVAALADGVALAEVIVETPSGPMPPVPLRVGVEVVDRAWERADVHPSVRHRLPALTEPKRVLDASRQWYSAHHSVALLPLGERTPVTGVCLRWVGPQGGTLKPLNLTLVDETKGTYHLVNPFAGLTDRWCDRGKLADKEHVVAEYLRPLRRAWLASRVVRLPEDKVTAILQGRNALPDGTAFEPYHTALVEEDVPFTGGQPDPDSTTRITRYRSGRVTVVTHSAAETFLVLGDVYYPGWEARLDGRPVPLYRTDSILRGVVVPPGDHVVEFVFRPRSLYLGAAITSVSALTLLSVLVVRRRRPRPAPGRLTT
jgi:hypothetical protein